MCVYYECLALKQINKQIRKYKTLEWRIILGKTCASICQIKAVTALVPFSKTTIEWDIICETNIFRHFTVCSLGL